MSSIDRLTVQFPFLFSGCRVLWVFSEGSHRRFWVSCHILAWPLLSMNKENARYVSCWVELAVWQAWDVLQRRNSYFIA